MQKDLGGLPPEQALDYMEKTPDLVIVNVAGRGFWDRNHFDGAVNIPTEDIGDDASIEKLKEDMALTVKKIDAIDENLE
jgi:hypothetical protein